MVDQNDIGTQISWQVVMGGNPYDLVDNKNIVSNSIDTSTQTQAPVQNIVPNQQFVQIPTQEIVQQVQPVIQQVSPVVQQNIPVQPVIQQVSSIVQQNIPVQQSSVIEGTWPSGFMKSLINFIATLFWQPNPENGKPTVVVSTDPNIVIPQVWVNQPVQKSWNAFDSIMGWVTWFLDKVEKNVEKVSGINIDSLGNMHWKEQIVQQSISPVQQIVTAQQNPVLDQNFVNQQTVPVQQIQLGQVSIQWSVQSVQTVAQKISPVVQQNIPVQQTQSVETPIQESVKQVQSVVLQVSPVVQQNIPVQQIQSPQIQQSQQDINTIDVKETKIVSDLSTNTIPESI